MGLFQKVNSLAVTRASQEKPVHEACHPFLIIHTKISIWKPNMFMVASMPRANAQKRNAVKSKGKTAQKPEKKTALKIKMRYTWICIMSIAVVMLVTCLLVQNGTSPVRYRLINSTIHAANKFLLIHNVVRFDTQAATDALVLMNRHCMAVDIPIILAEGTALGAVRDNALIPWDDDVDIMIEARHKGKFISDVLPMMEGFWIAKAWNNLNFITIQRSTVAIDIEFIGVGIPCSCTLTECTSCPVEQILDTMQPVTLGGMTFQSWGPLFLGKIYGESWQTPMHRRDPRARAKD